LDRFFTEPFRALNASFHISYIDSFHFVPRPDDGDEFDQEPSLWQPGVEEALKFMREAYAEGVIAPDSLTMHPGQVLNELFLTSRVGMYAINSPFDYPELDLVVVPPLEGPFGRPEVPGRSPVVQNYVINAVSSDAQIRAAMSIWDWMMTEEGAEFVTFGREGDHWNDRREDGTPVVSQEVFQERRWDTINRLPKPPGPRDNPRVDIDPYLQGTPEGQQLVEYIEMWQEYAIERPTRTMAQVPEAWSRRGEVAGLVWGTAMEIVTGDEPLSALDTMREEANERVLLEVARGVNELLSSD
jgi:ABC-type glycerol-3-phosphate transport system substrate-binding protein